MLVSYCHYDNSSAYLVCQELEDQLQEEEDKVSHLNKVKSKLEQQIDEVCIHIDLNAYRKTPATGVKHSVNLFCRVLLGR